MFLSACCVENTKTFNTNVSASYAGFSFREFVLLKNDIISVTLCFLSSKDRKSFERYICVWRCWIIVTVARLRCHHSATQWKLDDNELKADIFFKHACYLQCDTICLFPPPELIRPSSRSCSLFPPLVARPWLRTRSWSGCQGSTTVTFLCTSELQGEPREARARTHVHMAAESKILHLVHQINWLQF